MKSSTRPLGLLTALCAGLILACGAALAAKPDGDNHDKGKKPRVERPVELQVGAYFGDKQRAAAVDYYGKQRAAGRCPPGLAKKNNGCLPPGQAKKWQKGQPLPKGVVWYPVPREVVVRIGLPPPGYRYVRVVNDILLIAIGSQMVIDAIEDLIQQ